MRPTNLFDRRQVLAAGAGVAVATVVPRHVLGQGQNPPSETLNVAGVGTGGMGTGDLRQVAKEASLVALCDVDRRALDHNAKLYPRAKGVLPCEPYPRSWRSQRAW